jgi:hypothetical protein
MVQDPFGERSQQRNCLPFPRWWSAFPWPCDRLKSIFVSRSGTGLSGQGVWTAIDSQFPSAANETCIAIKTFGVKAVSKKSVSEMIIFAKDKRYDVKGDVQIETTIKSIKVAGGGFRITESSSRRGSWLGFRKKITYVLKVVDPLTIEIWDAARMTRYAKCGSQRPPI